MFLPEFPLKLFLIQPEVNHNPIQSFHLNQEFLLIKVTSPQSKLQGRQSFLIICERKLCFLNLLSPVFAS